MGSLLPDEPIDNATKFGFDSYSSALASTIKSKSLKTPFTIAIHGDWGSGKTSLMKTIAKKLESSSGDEVKVKTIWFNAWEFEKIPVPLWKIFLNRITMELQEIVADDGLKSKIKAAGQGLLALSSDILLKRFIGISLNEIESIKEKVWDDIKKINSLSENLSKYIEKALENDPSHRERLVIFIDDLDRCLPEQCVEVFEAIKLFLNSEKCVFIVGVDKDQILKAFEVKFGKKRGYSGLHYIEKFVQLQFDLPRKTSVEIQYFLMELASEQLKESPKTIELISHFIEPNPRKIKRWINSVLFLEELFRIKQQKQLLKSQVNVSVVSIWLFLKSFFPDFSVLIERDLSLLNAAIRVAKRSGTDEDMRKIGDFTMDRRLSKFLSTLQPDYLADQLKEIVYLSKLTPIEEISTLPAQMLKRIAEMPDEELSDQLTMLTEYGVSVLADRIIDRLDHVKSYEDYKEYSKMFDIFDLIFTTSEEDSIKTMLFEKIFHFLNRSTYGRSHLYSKIKIYISSKAVKEMIIQKEYLDEIIERFGESYSYEDANQNSDLLLNFCDDFSPEHINIIMKYSLNNNQIYDSFGARRNLTKIFQSHKAELSDEEIKNIQQSMYITI